MSKKEKTSKERVAEIKKHSEELQKNGMDKKKANDTAFYAQINDILKFR